MFSFKRQKIALSNRWCLLQMGVIEVFFKPLSARIKASKTHDELSVIESKVSWLDAWFDRVKARHDSNVKAQGKLWDSP